MKKLYFLTILLSLTSGHLVQGQLTDHWETAIFNNDTWSYFVGLSEPDPNWRSLTFNDSGWSQGPGGFGYSDNDDNTIIPACLSVYIRKVFTVADTAVISKALLSMDYDDAFVAYLNDVEIGRAGITGEHPAFDQPGSDHEAKMYAGGEPESFYIYKNQLKTCLLPGKNVLAIQVHNSSITSSDLSSNAFLSFGIKNITSNFRPVPSWFKAATDFNSTILPIVIINTDGGTEIPDSPRILASMKIISRGNGVRNQVTDQDSAQFLNYNGRINIELRGSASQSVEKKAYGFSTLKYDNINESNVPLLGLPPDNDWILNGFAFEPSLMRDYLCYNLSRMMGQYASRTVYCEVILNGSYNGIYLLEEKIKEGPSRVNVIKISTNDNSFPEVTGGYITKADKTTGGDPVAWTMSSYIGNNDVAYIHELPKPQFVTPYQNDYIKSVFDGLNVAATLGNSSVESGYPSIIDIPSFVDYMAINEFSANADAYQFSTYFHKDRNGKLRAGPIWDQNLTFGYDLSIWGYDRSKFNTWQFDNGDNIGSRFWKDLFNDQVYRCYFARRFHELIQPGHPLNADFVDSFIDSTLNTIREAALREEQRWGTIPDIQNEANKIKDFINSRITWMTINLGDFSSCSNPELPNLVISKINYSPVASLDFPSGDDQEFIEITNTGNSTINASGYYFAGTGFIYQFPAYSEIHPGASVFLASNKVVFRAKYGRNSFGQFTRNLSGEGENLVLADPFGNVIDNVKYSNLAPWPDADRNGKYIELIDNTLDNNDGANWRATGDEIVSVRDVSAERLFRCYPSPVTDKLAIETSGYKCFVQLTDLQGNILSEANFESESYIFDMSPYPQGLYLLRVKTVEKSFIRKIIKI